MGDGGAFHNVPSDYIAYSIPHKNNYQAGSYIVYSPHDWGYWPVDQLGYGGSFHNVPTGSASYVLQYNGYDQSYGYSQPYFNNPQTNDGTSNNNRESQQSVDDTYFNPSSDYFTKQWYYRDDRDICKSNLIKIDSIDHQDNISANEEESHYSATIGLARRKPETVTKTQASVCSKGSQVSNTELLVPVHSSFLNSREGQPLFYLPTKEKYVLYGAQIPPERNKVFLSNNI